MDDHKQFNLPQAEQPGLTPKPDFQSLGNIVKTDKTLNVKDRLIADDNEVAHLVGQKFKRVSFSTLLTGSVYSAAASDFLIGVTSLSLAASVGLPDPKIVGAGKHFIVKDEVGGAATTNITIRSEGERTIDGAATSVLNANYQAKEYYCDDINWFTK